MLYRALGVPARYVEGFMVEASAGSEIDVQNPGHAWVEIYIDGVGWVQVEVTGSAQEAPSDEINVTPAYQYKLYDGTPLYAKNEIVITPKLAELLEKGYSYEVSVSGALYVIGTGQSRIESFTLYDEFGNDVTSQYNIFYSSGVLEILNDNMNIISVYLYETRKVYDGTPIVIGDSDYEIIEGGEGVMLDIDFVADIKNAGKISLSMLNSNIYEYIRYRVYDENGKDVTEMYRIEFGVFEGMSEYDYMPIEIMKSKITLTASSATKVYDGKPLESAGVDITFGALAEGEELTAHTEGFITEVGIAPNVIYRCFVVGKDGTYTTNNYEFTFIDGELTVLEKE
jgi:hypothetical protein